jgi:hypothetical protein
MIEGYNVAPGPTPDLYAYRAMVQRNLVPNSRTLSLDPYTPRIKHPSFADCISGCHRKQTDNVAKSHEVAPDRVAREGSPPVYRTLSVLIDLEHICRA